MVRVFNGDCVEVLSDTFRLLMSSICTLEVTGSTIPVWSLRAMFSTILCCHVQRLNVDRVRLAFDVFRVEVTVLDLFAPPT